MNYLAMAIVLATILGSSVSALAGPLENLQAGWELAYYNSAEDVQVEKYEALIQQSEAALENDPNNPELLIWDAIIRSTYAGLSGGFSALKLVKTAKKSLEKSIGIDPQALQGSAYTSLGSLYAQVPGWPIAFGSDKKARKYLEKAVAINPQGIDSNYFHGLFLLNQKNYQGARSALLKAQQAAPRVGRSLADSGRQAEIANLLATLESREG